MALNIQEHYARLWPLFKNQPEPAKPKLSAEELLHWKRSVSARIAWRKKKSKERAKEYASRHKVTLDQFKEMCFELSKNKTYASIMREAETMRMLRLSQDRAV